MKKKGSKFPSLRETSTSSANKRDLKKHRKTGRHHPAAVPFFVFCLPDLMQQRRDIAWATIGRPQNFDLSLMNTDDRWPPHENGNPVLYAENSRIGIYETTYPALHARPCLRSLRNRRRRRGMLPRRSSEYMIYFGSVIRTRRLFLPHIGDKYAASYPLTGFRC